MTLEETIARNDELRTQLKGGIVEMSPAVLNLPAWFRGRVLYRMTLPHKYIDDDHARGCFVFAGYVFYWHIDEREQLTLSLYLAEDL